MPAIRGDHMAEVVPPEPGVVKVVGVRQGGLLEVDQRRYRLGRFAGRKELRHSVVNADVEVYSHHLDVLWPAVVFPKAKHLLASVSFLLNRHALNALSKRKLGNDRPSAGPQHKKDDLAGWLLPQALPNGIDAFLAVVRAELGLHIDDADEMRIGYDSLQLGRVEDVIYTASYVFAHVNAQIGRYPSGSQA